MQVFKSFFLIARQRVRALSIHFGVYMTIVLSFSFTAEKSIAENFKSSTLSVYIEDRDGTDASRALCAYLKSLHHVTEEPLGEEALADRIYYRTLNYALVIPQGFEEKLCAGNTEKLLETITIPGSSNGAFVDLQITQYISSLQNYLAGGHALPDAIRATDRALADMPDVKTVTFDTDSSVGDRPIFYYYQYLPYIFILVLFAGMAPILVTINGTDVRRRTLCSCLKVRHRNLALAAACALYALFTWLLFLLLGLLVFRQEFLTTYSLFSIGNSFAFLLFVVALTLFISSFSPNGNVLSMVSNVTGLSMSFLCGVFVPQSMLSEQVLSVAKFLPAYWYVHLNNMLGGVSAQTFDLYVYLQGIGIQLLFAVATFALLMAFSRR